MAHDHNIIDDDNQFTIDGVHRQVTNATGNRPSVQQFDHNCERLTFQMPRFVDGHDMLLCDRVEIHYTNTGRGTSVSNRPVVASIDVVEDLAIREDDENLLTFSWLIPDTATQYAGTLVFQFKFICNGETEDDPPAFVWHTAQYSFVDVFASLNITDVIVDGYPDLLAKLCTKVDNFALDINSFRNDKLDSKDAANTYATIHSHVELREETQEALNAHVGNKENPHSVTLGQLGVDASAAELNQMLGGVEVPIQSQLDEKVIKGTSVVNSESALVKPVPATAAPYAKVMEIGGKTRKCANLLDLSKVLGKSSTVTVNGDTLTVTGYIATTDIYNLKVGATYRFIANSTVTGTGGGGTSIVFYNGSTKIDGIYKSDTPNPNVAFTVPEGTTSATLYFYGSGSSTDTDMATYTNVMLNEGPTPLPHEPYFSGLRSSAVTEVESVGVNLIPYPYTSTTKTVNGITFTDNGDGSITVKGTATGKAQFFIFRNRKYGSRFVNAIDKPVPNDGYVYSDLFYETSGDGYLLFAEGTTVDKTFYPMIHMIHKGSTALPYTPYVRHTLPIPAEVQALDGYGWGVSDSVYNYIDFEKKQFVKRLGRVDLGSLGWSYQYKTMQANVSGIKDVAYTTIPNLLTTHYEPAASLGASDLQYMADKAITTNYAHPILYIKDTTYTDAATFKAAMAGVMLYYELAEPVVTDISDLLPTDSYIGVEGGCTVTMVNEYGYDVPNTVNFYEDTNEIVGADTFVGNLEGTAARAEADAEGKRLASREWVLEQIAAMIAQSTST